MTTQHASAGINLEQLRTAAIAKLARGGSTVLSTRTPDELLNELQVHQIELEMQVETLRESQAALEESRDRYVDLYDFAPVGYLTLDDNGLISEANLTACTLFGAERTHLLHHRFANFLADGQGESWHHRFKDAMQYARHTKFQIVLKRADGSLFHALVDGKRVGAGQGAALRLALTDISEHVNAERELAVHRDHLEQLVAARTGQLAASENKVSALLGQSLAGVFILQDGLIRYANPLFAEIFGYAAPLDLIDRMPFDCLVMPRDMERVVDQINNRGGEDGACRLCFVGLRRDGTPVHVELHSRRIEHLGKPATLGVVLDISARKRAQDERREHEAWLKAIANHAAAIIFLKREDGRYLFVNRRFEQIFHLKGAAIRGKTDHEIFPPVIADAFTKSDQAALQARRSVETETVLPQRDGEHTYLCVKFPLRDGAGKVYALGGIATDITERKQAEGNAARKTL